MNQPTNRIVDQPARTVKPPRTRPSSLHQAAREAHVVMVLIVDPYGGEYQFSFDPEMVANRPTEVGTILMTSYLAAVRHHRLDHRLESIESIETARTP